MSTPETYTSTVTSLYLAFYGRPADPSGLAFWSEQLSKLGGNVDAIKAAFAESEEARVRFGTDTGAERITEIYEQLFDRKPDAKGLAFWVNAVAQGDATLADVAIEVLNGAQEEDKTLIALRNEAAGKFTAKIKATGSAYDGNAAVEAAQVLVRAVKLGSDKDDIDALVDSTAVLADVASTSPEVVEAMESEGDLLDLLDTEEGAADPVALVQSLAETANAAKGNPSVVALLMRGGGMPQVLKSLPEGTTLKDLVGKLGKGGLKATLESIFGTDPKPGKPEKPGKPGNEAPDGDDADGDDADGAMSLEYHLAGDSSALVLKTVAGSITGVDVATGLVLEDLASGTPKAATGTFTVEGEMLAFEAPLAAGLYRMAWQADTFKTADGHADAGSITFAGGNDGLVSIEGFGVDKVTTVTGDLARAATEQANEAFIAGSGTAERIATGGGQDVVVDIDASLEIVVGAIDGAADLILGFDAGGDSIALEGGASAAIDDNADGKIAWTAAATGKTAVGASDEAVAITVASAIAVGGADALAQTVATLNGALDVSGIATDDDLLILAKDESGSGAILFQFLNKDGNGQIDAAELSPITAFTDGAPDQSDIVLVGAQAVTA